MCEPLTLIGTALSVGGALVGAQQQQATVAAQNRAQQEAAELSRRARQAELARQAEMEKEGIAAWDQSADQLSKQNRVSQQDQAQQNMVQQYDAGSNTNPEGQYLSGQNLAAPEVKADIARQVTESARDARARAVALARLSAYGTVDAANNNAIGNTNSQLTTLNGIRRGSLGVSQFEQAVPAATVTPGSTVLADVMTGVGGLASRAGGQGKTFSGLFGSSVPASTGNPGRIY